MNLRFPALLMVLALPLACAPESGEQADAESAAEAMPEMTADEAALEQIRADYVTHYNMHHANVVAAMFVDSAFGLWADGEIDMTRADIEADLTADMAASPTLGLTTGETMVFGDQAVARGSYNVSMTPEGAPAPMTMTGDYLTHFRRVNGEWKIAGVITNFSGPPAMEVPVPEGNPETPPENSTMKTLLDAYEVAFNAADAAAVANLYTEDAVVSISNRPQVQGRAAIQSLMAERFAAGSPKIELHGVGTQDLGDGWALDGGWYEINATGEQGPITQMGAYLGLARQQADGSWKLHWVVSNGQPRPAS